MAVKPNEDEFCVREVWADNLDSEFDLIRAIVDDFPYVSMDTEFPGTVVRPTLPKDSPDHNYQSLRANVNILKIIQVGLTLCDESGSLPRCGSGGQFCVWQFNFRDFNIREDVYAQDSIELLKQSGMDFIKNKERGVDSLRFAELMMSSGLVLNPDVHWITFHSAYDFGYLLKALTSQKLPAMEVDFLTLLRVYFPNVYDVKYLMKFHDSLYGGLNRLAEILGVKRIGKSHQSGSDSLLTSCCFRELKHSYFTLAIEKFGGVLFGLGVDNCGAQ